MKKMEAMTVLNEIYRACPEFRNSNVERLDPDLAKIRVLPNGFFELRVKCELNDESRKAIKPILETYKLVMTETKGSVNIFRPR